MKKFYYALPIIIISIFLGCNINPIGPSLKNLSSEQNYFPLGKYSEYDYESSGNDTMVLTVNYSSNYNNSKVYKVKEMTKANTTSYYLISDKKGVFFYFLDTNNPFLKYPLITDFTWEYAFSFYYYIFSVLSLNETIGQYNNVAEIQWDFYNNTLNKKYVKTCYYYFKDGIGPVQIVQDNITYTIKDIK